MNAFIKYTETFIRLHPPAMDALGAILKKQTFDKNQLIQPTDSQCRNIYFVCSGMARIFYYKNGEDITEHFAFEGNVIVRAESLFTGNATPKGIQALEPSEVIAIPSGPLIKLYDDFPEIERLFRLIFEKEYVNTLHRVESLQMKTATERYLDLMHESQYINRIPLKFIASYLGITPVSLSRIRASLT